MDTIILSSEQEEFLNQALRGNNILVNACVGSGKTTAIQQLCNRISKDKIVLYLTYNRLLKLDAQKKIKQKNVIVQNYHGFAYSCLKKMLIKASVSELISKFLKEKPEIDHYDVLVIDEYQDIDTELSYLLEYIKKSNPQMQIIAVGDMQQKIYDKTELDVTEFIDRFLEKHLVLEFTQCFRLSEELAAKLGRIWNKRIIGVNSNCIVEEMNPIQVVEFLSMQKPCDILCLGKREGDLSKTLNTLEQNYADIFNKKSVFASIRDTDSSEGIRPSSKNAIFTTFDSCKGLERRICVIFDFTEDYWGSRMSKPLQDYDILRNIFCVAASRGKERIIFVTNGGNLLSEKTLSTRVDTPLNLTDVYISHMFEFKNQEDIEKSYALLQVTQNVLAPKQKIIINRADGMIDLSPCIGIFQEAMYFEEYSIDKDIELYRLLYERKNSQLTEEINKLQQASLEEKTLFLVSLETNQDRYRTQVELPFIDDEKKRQIYERLQTRLQPNENVQVRCVIRFAARENGPVLFSAHGLADVVKDGTIYELKFVSELSHEHFLQCACYMIAQNLERGILWNIQNNDSYEIRIPDKNAFLDSVVRTITKNHIHTYYEPVAFHTELPTELPGQNAKRKSRLPDYSPSIIKKTKNEKTVQTQNKDKHNINGFDDVKDLFTQQTAIIRDRYGSRWVQCEKCRKIKMADDFMSYGGKNHINLGLCRDCYRIKIMDKE